MTVICVELEVGAQTAKQAGMGQEFGASLVLLQTVFFELTL